MNSFKICLLTPYLDYGDNCRYRRDYFTIYDEQEQTVFGKFKISYNFNFSYDENITFKKNAAIDFSFKMDKYYNDGNDFLLNPYIDNLNVGTLIEYTDYFGMVYRLAIKDIELTFSPHNIVYTYSCQDAFSFQYTKQHDGYTLINDSTLSSFIGPKTIDEWVTDYIIPQCKIGFTYIPLQGGLYKSFNGENRVLHYKEDNKIWIAQTQDKNIFANKIYYDDKLKTYRCKLDENNTLEFLLPNDDSSSFPTRELNIPIGVDYYNQKNNLLFPKVPYERIGNTADSISDFKPADMKFYIKRPYLKQNFSFLFEPFIFSCSNSSAGNALILLAQEKGLILEVDYETNTFWFTEEKSTTESGLIYSPKNELQNLSFSLSGDSLTSVINVEGPTIGDDLITLLPIVPIFWQQYFLSEDWKNTKYCEDLYSQINSTIRKRIYFKGNLSNISDDSDNDNENYFLFNIYCTLPTDNRDFSISKQSVIKTNSKDLVIFDLPLEEDVVKIEYKQDNYFRLKIKKEWLTTSSSSVTLLETSIIFIQFEKKDSSSEDIEFAEMADKIPYLENRIIRFDYLRDIYPTDIFNHLQDLLLNKLRIVNGQLLSLQQSYFNKLQDKVNILSNISSNGDILMSNIFNEFIDWSKESTSNLFWEKHDLNGILYNNYRSIQNKYLTTATTILDREQILTNCTNKFFNYYTEMLKYLYKFRQYWEWEKTPEMTNGKFWITCKDAYMTDDIKVEYMQILDQLQQFWYSFSKYANLCGFVVPDYFANNKKYKFWNDDYTLNNNVIPQVIATVGNNITFYYDESKKTQTSDIKNWMSLLDGNEIKYFHSITDQKQKQYFNIDDSGKQSLLWKSHISNLSFNNVENFVCGPEVIYTFLIIQRYYKTYDDSKRQNLLAEKDYLWKQIYKDCNVLLLESNFTSSTAYDSKSLLNEAINYYKDYEKPQTNFSLTVSQFESISSPLKVGDQICLNVEDLYKEYSIIKEALEKKLFVTEISYDLRKKDNINISIQTISYQDRLLSKLVKLIK